MLGNERRCGSSGEVEKGLESWRVVETLFIHRPAIGAGALAAEFLTTLAAGVAVGVMTIVLPKNRFQHTIIHHLVLIISKLLSKIFWRVILLIRCF